MKTLVYSFFLLALFIFAFTPSLLFAERNSKVKASLVVNIKSSHQSKLYLYSFYGTRTTLTDSATRTGSHFEFRSQVPYPKGYYRLQFNDTNYFDIILSPNEKVILASVNDDLKKNLTVVSSRENKLLWDLRSEKSTTSKKIKALNIEASYLDRKSTEYQKLAQRKDSISKSSDTYTRHLVETNPSTYFALTTKALLLPLATDDPALYEKYKGDDRAFLKDHFFANIDFSDPGLIRTTLLPNRYMKYFETYVDYDEDGFKRAVDLILSKASANEQVHELSLDFLMELFNTVGPEVIFEYITENHYLKNTCNDNKNSSVNKKASGYRALMIGEIAPLISVTDTAGRVIELDKIISGNELTILFFWSSHCGFCEQELPGLKNIYAKYRVKGLAVYAVSLDESKTEWKSAVERNQLEWINVSSLQGWRSPAAEKYMVNKTPTIYLIGKNGKILGKNLKGEKLEAVLQDQFK